jgi:TonB family protein
MRKAELLCVISIFVLASSLPAQNAASADSAEMPKDARALLLLAANSNNLTDAEIEPWHLKATFELLDESGNPLDQGTYEEFWAGPLKCKIVFDSPHFSQSDYCTEKGRYRAGVQTAPPGQLGLLEGALTNPVPVSPQQVDKLVIDREKREEGGSKFICVKEAGFSTPNGVRQFVGPEFCLDADRPVLRADTNGITQFNRGDFRAFDGRFVAGEMVAVQHGKQVMRVHVDVIEPLASGAETALAPTPDAVPVPMRVNISAGVAQGNLAKKVSPEYPIDAKLSGISGTVILQALIGKDGHIADVHVVSGPPALQRAALDAVKQWEYRPYLLNGQPVEVNTTVNVVFALSR